MASIARPHTKSMTRPAAAAVACAVWLSTLGCTSWFGPGPPPVDSVWRVVELGGGPVPRLPDNRAPTLRLDAENLRASGFTGCNRTTGSYVLAGRALSFGLMASTRMACEATSASVEMAYMEAIDSVSEWRRREDALELLDAEGTLRMRLEPAGRVDTPFPQ